MSGKLIASSPTQKDLEKIINEYFCSPGNYKITEDGKVFNATRGKIIDGFIIRQSRGRFRFEHRE